MSYPAGDSAVVANEVLPDSEVEFVNIAADFVAPSGTTIMLVDEYPGALYRTLSVSPWFSMRVFNETVLGNATGVTWKVLSTAR